MENTTVGIKTCKTEKKSSIFIVDKRLKKDKVKFLIEYVKKEIKIVYYYVVH